MKPFLTNKGHINSNEIVIKNENKTIIEGTELYKTSSEHYVNIGKTPTNVPGDNNIFNTDQGIELIRQSFCAIRVSILSNKIRQNCNLPCLIVIGGNI